MSNLFKKDGFDFIEDKTGLYIRLTSDNLLRALEYAFANNITSINITVSGGFKNKNLSFLDNIDVTWIKGLTLIFHEDEIEISSIHKLSYLERLSINVPFNQKIDFDRFPYLKRCNIYWNKNIQNLNKRNLTELYLSKFEADNLSYLSTIVTMEKLSLDQSNIKTLEGIEPLTKIEYLNLGYLRNITTLEPIFSLVNLKKLKLYNLPKIEAINDLSTFRHLESLYIESLKNLRIIEGEDKLTLNDKTIALCPMLKKSR